jgi:hypothetical protein
MYARTTQSLFIILCALFVFNAMSCRSVPSIVPDNGNGANTVRTDIATITEGQTELAVTGNQITNTSDNLENTVNQLEQSIISGTDADADFAEILRAVRKRPLE